MISSVVYAGIKNTMTAVDLVSVTVRFRRTDLGRVDPPKYSAVLPVSYDHATHHDCTSIFYPIFSVWTFAMR